MAGRVAPAAQAARPGAFLRPMKARLGAPKAITATTHTLARLMYTMLGHGTAYVRQSMADYEQHYRCNGHS
jgi:transposase